MTDSTTNRKELSDKRKSIKTYLKKHGTATSRSITEYFQKKGYRISPSVVHRTLENLERWGLAKSHPYPGRFKGRSYAPTEKLLKLK